MQDYIRFLESELGVIQKGWKDDVDVNLQILKFNEMPFEGCSVYSTLGLSSYCLGESEEKRGVRQELNIISKEDFGDKNIPAILQQISIKAITENKPYLRGEIIELKGGIFEGYDLTAMYISKPVYFEDSFWVYEEESIEPVVQVWVFPIFPEEAKMVVDEGWEVFEDELENKDPDLTDFRRDAIA